jgi:hypothetical protein
MDEPEVFDKASVIIEGLYYIETDSYFPLRGNGWYYHSLVQYNIVKIIILLPKIMSNMLSILLQPLNMIIIMDLSITVMTIY